MERRRVDAQAADVRRAHERAMRELAQQERVAKAEAEAAKARGIEARAAAKAHLDEIKATRESAKERQERDRKKLADIRSRYASKLCSDLLNWSYFHPVAHNIARLSKVIDEAIGLKTGVLSGTPPDFFGGPVPRDALVVLNPHAAKGVARSFASERFAWRLCNHKTPISRPPTFPAPAALLDAYLRRCCPDYPRLCGARYSGRALLTAAGEHADLAFLTGVWPSLGGDR